MHARARAPLTDVIIRCVHLRRQIRLEDSRAIEVREYFRYCRSHFRIQYYKRLLQFMSPALRGMVTRHQHCVWIGQVWFFNCNDDGERDMFITDVGLALVLEAYAPNEQIIRFGAEADAMYIVQRGCAGRNLSLASKLG